MDLDEKKEWVDALRSGKYMQGRGQLRRYDEFCCLGVFLDLFGGGRWAGPDNRGIYEYTMRDSGGECKEIGMPPLEVCDTHDVSMEDMRRLAILNDEPSSSFSQIADYIESYL
jgi:hypothetical protein